MRKSWILAALLAFSVAMPVNAEKFDGKGVCVVENNIAPSTAQETALNRALSNISQQAALAVIGRMASVGQTITEDVARMETASVITIINQKYEWGMSENNLPMVTAIVSADVDIKRAVEMTRKKMRTTASDNSKSAQNNGRGIRAFWDNDIIAATGLGLAPTNATSIEEAKYMSEKAARLDAYRRLAEYANGIHVTTNRQMTSGEVDAIITGAKVTAVNFDDKGNCSVTVSVPLFGVNSVMSNIDIKTEAKKTTDASKPKGPYTGVIIDCSDAPVDGEDKVESKGRLTPVLLPVVKTTNGEVIYSVNNFDKQTVIKRGMASYATDYNNTERAGNNPYIVKAVRIDDNGCSPVISEADGKFIKDHNLCNDVNLVPLSTRGHRDSREHRYYGTYSSRGHRDTRAHRDSKDISI